MTRSFQTALLALSGLAAAMPASAQPAEPVAQEPPIVITRRLPPAPDLLVRTVFIGDLDLKSVAGRQEMEKRVGQAVDDMCAMPTPLPSYKQRLERPCRDEAWASARPQMHSAVQRADGS